MNEIVEDERGLIGWKVKKNPKDEEEEPEPPSGDEPSEDE